MKITRIYLILFAGILIFLSTTAYLFRDLKDSGKTNVSPVERFDNSTIIKFNHALHVKDAGVKCEECHVAAKTSVSSKDNLNPKKDNCATCHDVKDQKNCNFCHYEGVYKKLKASKTELLFSHKQHADVQKKPCLDCHQGMDKVKYASELAAVIPAMENCYTCHDNRKASTFCEGCHKNLTNLKPKNHLNQNYLNEHGMVSDVNSGKNNCMMCHSDNFC
jgi:hypothetical protein